MNKPQHSATIVQFPADRVVRRDGVPVVAAPAPAAAGAGRTHRADIDFGSWYHFAAIKDQDRPRR